MRSVPLIAQAAAVLDELRRRDHFTGAEDLVFASDTGGPLDEGDMRDEFYAALTRAKLGHLREKADPIVFHDLRHTFGTLAVQAWPLHDVQAYMGHPDIQTTMIYVHHVPKAAAANELTRLVAKSVSRNVSPTAQNSANEPEPTPTVQAESVSPTTAGPDS